jgi:hypothetical protein
MNNNNEDNLDFADNFLGAHFPLDSSNNPSLYSNTVDAMLLQHDLNTWKQAHTEAMWEIEKLKSEKAVLELEVSIWKARFLALRSGFLALDRKMREILGSFEGWQDPVQ